MRSKGILTIFLWPNTTTRAQAMYFLRFLGHTQLDIYIRWDSHKRVISSSQRSLPVQHTANKRDKYPGTQRDLNPRSQKSLDRNSTSQRLRPAEWVLFYSVEDKLSGLLPLVVKIQCQSVKERYQQEDVSVANRKILERIINRKDTKIRAEKRKRRTVLVTAARFSIT